MANQELEMFVHSQGVKPKVVLAPPDETLRDVLIRSGVLKDGQKDILVFVGECEDALKEQDDIDGGVDQHAPVDVTLTLEALEIKRKRHVHCHQCRLVVVDVNFGGKTKTHKFSPAVTVGVVTQWARKKLRLDPAAASDYVLQQCNSTERPRPDKHLGELVDASKCSVCFDLVKEITPQG